MKIAMLAPIWSIYADRLARPTDDVCSGGARALLHLIEFEEPFGFSLVEAMAARALL